MQNDEVIGGHVLDAFAQSVLWKKGKKTEIPCRYGGSIIKDEKERKELKKLLLQLQANLKLCLSIFLQNIFCVIQLFTNVFLASESKRDPNACVIRKLVSPEHRG